MPQSPICQYMMHTHIQRWRFRRRNRNMLCMNYKTMRKTTTTGKLTTRTREENNNVKRAQKKSVYLSLRVAHVDIRRNFCRFVFFIRHFVFYSNRMCQWKCRGNSAVSESQIDHFSFFVVCLAKADSMLLFLHSFSICIFFCVQPSQPFNPQEQQKIS